MLGFVRSFVLESVEAVFDTVFHAGIEVARVITLPIEINATTQFALPICFDGTTLFQCVD